MLSCPRGVLNLSESMQKTLVTEETRCKSFASLFKGCGVQGRRPWSLAAASETSLSNPSARGEFQNSPVDCFERGDALGKRASPCSGHERGLLLPQGSNEKLPDYHNKMHLPGENLRLWLLRERRLCAALGKSKLVGCGCQSIKK